MRHCKVASEVLHVAEGDHARIGELGAFPGARQWPSAARGRLSTRGAFSRSSVAQSRAVASHALQRALLLPCKAPGDTFWRAGCILRRPASACQVTKKALLISSDIADKMSTHTHICGAERDACRKCAQQLALALALAGSAGGCPALATLDLILSFVRLTTLC